MAQDIIWQVGVVPITMTEVWIGAVCGVAFASAAIVARFLWHRRDRRIERARLTGDPGEADYLAENHPERPISAQRILLAPVLGAVGFPALNIVMGNAIAGLQTVSGDFAWAAPFLMIGFLALCEAIWKQIRRNAMTPEELAQFEEDEEHRRWMAEFNNQVITYPLVAIGLFVCVLLGMLGLFGWLPPY